MYGELIMPLLRRYVSVPELPADRMRELDVRASEILLLLPRDLGEIRYVHERLHETLDRWVATARDEEPSDENVVYLKVVD
jgi:hypothetical protein